MVRPADGSPDGMTKPPRPSIRGAIEARRAAGGLAFVPFLTAGYPDWESSERAIETLADSGADALELGVPFSDPLADGPTIQFSSQRALEAGVSLPRLLERIERVAAYRRLPILLMSYVNPIVTLGAEEFPRRATAAGVSGVLLSDLPPEELPDLWAAVRGSGLETAVLVAPTTSPGRLAALARAASGYVYCVTRTGVTGRGGTYSSNLSEQVALVRRETKVPVIAGFGIRAPEDVPQLKAPVDGVIVGAKLIEILRGDEGSDSMAALARFARGLRAALDAA